MKSVKILAVLLAVSVAGVAGAGTSMKPSIVQYIVSNGSSDTTQQTLTVNGTRSAPTLAVFECTTRNAPMKPPVSLTFNYNSTQLECAIGTLAGTFQKQQTNSGTEGTSEKGSVAMLSCVGTGSISINEIDCLSNASASQPTTITNKSNDKTF